MCCLIEFVMNSRIFLYILNYSFTHRFKANRNVQGNLMQEILESTESNPVIFFRFFDVCSTSRGQQTRRLTFIN